MKRISLFGFTIIIAFVYTVSVGLCVEAPVSDATAECLACHELAHPGIIHDWRNSRHSMLTPEQAMAVEGLGRKVSSATVPEAVLKTSVGCAECHTLRPDRHSDTFDHNGYEVHVVVSPEDCAVCHTTEADQYSKNIMSHAHTNLADNAVYRQLETSVIGATQRRNKGVQYSPADPLTAADACYYCHGTRLEVTGKEVRDTEIAGELEFPVISGWPNQGVGRINLDGSRGSCAACHTRHQFSIQMARKPYTCKECHVGPDVPAFPVYSASKHGNIQASMDSAWDYRAVPWTVGEDFSAPTCGACHVSLLVNDDGEVVAERSHQMNNRLPWRIYGLIYAHPHPQSPDTTIIRNKDGQPLPTDLSGGFAQKYLIDKKEMQIRTATMQNVCLSCHSSAWVDGHWKKFEHSIQSTNAEILTGTNFMRDIWKRGLADGLARGKNPFDEAIEKKWQLTWLFYANSIRFSSAMAGGGDYGVFAGGRYQLSQSIAEMSDWYILQSRVRKRK
jgi:hypothetical protein